MSFHEFITRPSSKVFEPYISFYFQQKAFGNKQDNPLIYEQNTLPTVGVKLLKSNSFIISLAKFN